MIRFRHLIIFLASIWLLFSCHKRPFDKRNKFIGNWTFTSKHDNWSLGRTPMHMIDSVIFVGKVFYHTNHASKGSLEIEFYPGTSRHFILADDGKLSVASETGQITENSLTLNLNNSNTGQFGMGSGDNYIVSAIKN